MITFKEVCGGQTVADIPLTHQHNLEELLKRINVVRTAYGKPMFVTSGYRSRVDHIRIYNKINADRRRLNLQERTVPWGSGHLSGQSVDIADSDGSLKAWILDNISMLESAGLWCEDFSHTATWIHFQTYAPRSGKRFFIP
jgi:uncharacterized protein YcbK (DUF882 family)